MRVFDVIVNVNADMVEPNISPGAEGRWESQQVLVLYQHSLWILVETNIMHVAHVLNSSICIGMCIRMERKNISLANDVSIFLKLLYLVWTCIMWMIDIQMRRRFFKRKLKLQLWNEICWSVLQHFELNIKHRIDCPVLFINKKNLKEKNRWWPCNTLLKLNLMLPAGPILSFFFFHVYHFSFKASFPGFFMNN